MEIEFLRIGGVGRAKVVMGGWPSVLGGPMVVVWWCLLCIQFT
ncbi:hypothetical protein A2U01_0043074, partial [Trifolium medium]|nr:hypothetical protein [Trifolium medium]